MSSFNQGVPTVPTLINSSNCIVLGNTSSGTALTVQQLGAGAVMNVATSTGSSALFVNAAGNVGIGVTNPSLPLDVLGGVKVNNSNQTTALSIQPDGSDYYGSIIGKSITWDGTYYNIYSDGTNRGGAAIQMQWRDIAFYTYSVGSAATTAQLTPTQFNAYQRMTITPGGNVGIGTTNPDAILTISAPTTATTAVTCKLVNAFTSNAAYINFTNSADSRSAFIGQDGVGLFAFATGALAMGTNTDVPIIFAPNYSTSGEKMRITGAGRVGIGVTNPGYTLQVNGSIGMVGGTSIPLTLPATGSQTSYSITLAASGTWYTVISDARINATITGAIGQSDLTSTIFIATLIATGGASASMTLVTGNAANIRVSGTALQFLANSSSYGLACGFTLIRHN